MREYLPSLDWKMARTIAFARRNFHGMKHVARIAINSLSKSERIYTLFFVYSVYFLLQQATYKLLLKLSTYMYIFSRDI